MGFAKIPTALGFPVRNQLIVGMPENYTWGLGLQDTVDPCLEQALEGLLYGFQIKESQGEGKSRLRIFIKDLETGDIDMVTAGFESADGSYSFFAQGFCRSLSCPVFDHKKPILLVPKRSTKGRKKAIFCNLFQGQKALRYGIDSIVDCQKVLEALAPNFPAVPLYPVSADDQPECSPSIDDYKDPQPGARGVSFDDLMALNNACLKRLGWSSEKGRDYLIRTYGKRSRQVLSDGEFLEFTQYLQDLVDSLDSSVEDSPPF